ncbi:adenylate/guanylate cyclase domain-containing protein [Fulvivirgaceae bacterium BMA10]|uniref:Adenylate/guanylate cyclase domain-containing protein n=1 Tax=Splendidivirga corallicola TaxID=3051826 RepID=A0ABT8KN60_9BACT|nr:adenylate/guanylate cyclase domain-containing protein [Fulvivirgaceae bacterium BMA10]
MKSKVNKKYFRTIAVQTIIWTTAFTFWTIMREFGQEVVREYEALSPTEQVRIHLVLGIFAGLLFGSLEYFFEKKVFRNVSLGKAIFIGSLSYLIITILLLLLGMRIFARIVEINLSWEETQNFLFSRTAALFIFYCFLVGFLIDFIKQVDKKFGPGNLIRMLKGEFYGPKEDERIFMFLDLKSSTAIAEKLGHIKYSQLLQDCFVDIDIVAKYHAEIYQYVGDEVVLTWQRKKGLIDANCIRAFFAFTDRLEKRSDHYIRTYDVLPEFKAGLNMGKITIAEVGEIKREIAYHGDTINTASRIQAKCNDFDQQILISENLQQHLNGSNDFSRKLVGEVTLKGKLQAVNIYSVERILIQ